MSKVVFLLTPFDSVSGWTPGVKTQFVPGSSAQQSVPEYHGSFDGSHRHAHVGEDCFPALSNVVQLFKRIRTRGYKETE